MPNRGLQAVVNDLCVDCFGYDWFDFRDRLAAFYKANPEKARELIHYAKELLEAWDHD